VSLKDFKHRQPSQEDGRAFSGNKNTQHRSFDSGHYCSVLENGWGLRSARVGARLSWSTIGRKETRRWPCRDWWGCYATRHLWATSSPQRVQTYLPVESPWSVSS